MTHSKALIVWLGGLGGLCGWVVGVCVCVRVWLVAWSVGRSVGCVVVLLINLDALDPPTLDPLAPDPTLDLPTQDPLPRVEMRVLFEVGPALPLVLVAALEVGPLEKLTHIFRAIMAASQGTTTHVATEANEANLGRMKKVVFLRRKFAHWHLHTHRPRGPTTGFCQRCRRNQTRPWT